jgi:hypothetical protein
MRKGDYPPEERCLARRAYEPGPCQNPRSTCEVHCNANLRKKPGHRCAQWPMANGRCRLHGGKSLKAGAHPRFRDGSRSKYRFRGKLHKRYQQALSDPELTHYRDSVAVLDTLIREMTEQWEEGGSPAQWRRLTQLWERLQIAWNARDRQKVTEAMAEISLIIERGSAQSKRESQIVSLLEARRKHADSESRRWLSETLTFTVEEAEFFHTQLGHSVRRHLLNENITREKSLRRVQEDMAAIGGQAGVSPKEA